MLLFRQRGFRERMSVRLDLRTFTGDAGITVFLSSDYHYRLQVRKNGGKISASLIRHIHDFEAETETVTLPESDTLDLEIESDDENYSFYAGGRFLGKATVYGLAAEGCMNMCFTGSLFGVYAEKGDAVFIDGMKMESITEDKENDK